MLIFIVSYGHTVKIGQIEFSLCDKYNIYVHFFQINQAHQKYIPLLHYYTCIHYHGIFEHITIEVRVGQ